jgi:hypothetical protein
MQPNGYEKGKRSQKSETRVIPITLNFLESKDEKQRKTLDVRINFLVLVLVSSFTVSYY